MVNFINLSVQFVLLVSTGAKSIKIDQEEPEL